MDKKYIKQLTIVLLLVFLYSGVSSVAETVLLNIGGAAQPGVELKGGTWQKEQNMDVLKVLMPAGNHQIQLLSISNPPITASSYILKGRVRGVNVGSDAYLEMLSTFSDGNTFFSRTQSKSGPQGEFSGSFDWHYFSLPFSIGDRKSLPHSLMLNFVGAEGAEIDLAALQLTESPLSRENAWFSEQIIGFVGGILGVLLGCFGAMVGVLTSRGKARWFVLRGFNICIALGLLASVGGAVAISLGQPQYICTTLLVSGSFIVLLMVGLQKIVAKRYQEIELRRMQAIDSK